MPNASDSLKEIQKTYDSLRKSIVNSNTFSFKINEPQVQAAFVIALVTIATVIMGFAIKDYIIPGILEKRTKKREGQLLFNHYKVHLFKSTLHFANRLSEIFRTRSHYLWTETPKSDFYEYKYLSTIYRLCVLFGWIRAYRLEESSVSIKKTDKEIHLLSDGLDSLVSSFADGQNIEMYVAKALCELQKIKLDDLPPDTLEQFSVEIDHAVQEVLTDSGREYISDLDSQKREHFILKIKQLMDKLNIDNSLIDSKKAEVIKEVSIKQGLIYRDWQQAIGDLMLEKVDAEETRKYNVIGYKQFEEMFLNGTDDEKKWLKRAEKMFANLDFRVDPKFDARIAQLKNAYSGLYSLLSILFKIDVGPKPMSEEDFKKIPIAV